MRRSSRAKARRCYPLPACGRPQACRSIRVASTHAAECGGERHRELHVRVRQGRGDDRQRHHRVRLHGMSLAAGRSARICTAVASLRGRFVGVLPQLRWDWAHPCHILPLPGWFAPATSVLGLYSPLPHLHHREWAHPCHTLPLPPLHRHWARPCRVCTGTARAVAFRMLRCACRLSAH